ncbi:MAG TPA: hypothetical protein VK447_09565 [Myxococcaceae bacterium]|nr:hypothetical protein [Myxococcaceae bacterium]
MTGWFQVAGCSLLLLASPVLAAAGAAPAPKGGQVKADSKAEAKALKAELLSKHGEAHKARIDRGIDQVAALWRPEDGDLAAFARENFISDPRILGTTFERLETSFEQLDGHFNEIGRALRRPSEVEIGPMMPVDPLLAAVDPSAHLTEDLFAGKIGFVALLNWPLTTLNERLARGKDFTRQQWAESRLTSRFSRRLPPQIQQESSRAGAKADLYIAQYNLWMHHLVDEKGERLFPKGLRLISHWNLRDELKGNYADPRGLDKQRMIIQVMSRIVSQTIPAAVIDNPRLDWNPFTNAVTVAPAAEVEDDAPRRDAKAEPAREPDTRYERLLAHFKASRKADPYSPVAPTAILRSFESREIPEERVRALLVQVLSSPVVPKVAAEIQQRLGRKLEPQELWYDGFRPRSAFSEKDLDATTRKRYPTAEAFAADIPNLLQRLGFSPEKAKFLADHIRVDPSRGAGHAMPAYRRGDFPRLRTRVEKSGMDYKGYNIAIHELGHNVEQVFSLYEVDHTLLTGVPNNSFTEALAFVFQARDLELLGLAKPDPAAERLRVLNDFWQTWEIAGVSLVDIDTWHWMYEHPNATPAELREAVMRISRDVWNRYYAPVLGAKDSVLLGIYSHMIAYPLYLCDYPLGHMVAFQIEERLREHGPLGAEFERMARFGNVTPDQWMIHATGAPVGADPLLRATERVLAQPAGKP